MSSASPPGRKEDKGSAAAKDKNRPAMQIYRPPGSRRSADSPASPTPEAPEAPPPREPKEPPKREEGKRKEAAQEQRKPAKPEAKAKKAPERRKGQTTFTNSANGHPASGPAKPTKAAGTKQPDQHPPTSHQGHNKEAKPSKPNGQEKQEQQKPAEPRRKTRVYQGSQSNSHLPRPAAAATNGAEAAKEPPQPLLKAAISTGDLNPQAKPFEPSGKFVRSQSPAPLFPPLNGSSGPALPPQQTFGAAQALHHPPPPKTPPPRRQSPGPPGANGEAAKPRLPPRRQNSFIKLEPGAGKAKQSSAPKDPAEIRSLLDALELPSASFAVSYLEGECKSPELAAATAQLLVQAAIEEGRPSKAVAKLCAALADMPSGEALRAGLVAAAWQYFECRDKLRTEHFKYWLAFLNLGADLFAALGAARAAELAGILFQLYDYMLREPVLEELKIEELECLISALMGTGYELERECPQRLAALRHRIRDAFIQATEPWARKMILLLVELSASGWRLPGEASEYYFQTVSTSA